jgi:hypothetical protein
MHKALGSIPSTTHKIKGKNKNKEVKMPVFKGLN